MWGPPQALAFPNLLAVPLVVSTSGNTDRDLDKALSWPEQGLGKALVLLRAAPQPLCLMHWHVWSPWEGGPGRPLTLTIETLSYTLPARAAPPGRVLKAKGLDMASSTGNHFPAPWTAGASLTPSPLASSATAPKVWFQMGFVRFWFCLGCVGHCGLRFCFSCYQTVMY